MNRRAAGLVVVGAVASRLWLDLCTSVPLPGLPGSLAHAGTLAVMLVCAAGALDWRRRVPGAMWGVCAVWGAVVLMGALRSEADGGVAAGLRYGSGVLVALAVAATWSRVHQRVWPMAMLGAALLPVGLSLALLPSDRWVALHEVQRFIGPYAVLHALAMAMGVIAAMGIGVAIQDRRPVSARAFGAVMGGLALVVLAASATRSGVVFVGTAVLVTAAVQRRWRLLGVLMVAAVLGIVAVPGLRVRMVELVLALGGRAPERGWEWLGTGRIAIWTRSWAAFSELPLLDRCLGTGLAGYETFWKGKEPHSEYLSLMYQFGPIGPLVFIGTSIAAIVSAVRHGVRERALFIGLVVATLATSLVGSTLLIRLVLSWVFWASVGVLLSGSAGASAESD